ncbi:MAG: hypothetical protein ACOX6T_23105 [Myxococcales bacterium]|jgi:hypothetical protein
MNKHLVCCGIVALGLVVYRPAWAARVAVLDFSGSRMEAKRARASLVERLKRVEGLEVLEARTYLAKALRAGVPMGELSIPDGVRKGAAAAGADGLFAATVFKDKGRWQTRLRFVDASGSSQLDRVFTLGEQQAFAAEDLEEIATFARGIAGSAAAADGKSAAAGNAAAGKKERASFSLAAAPRAAPKLEARLLAGGLRRGFTLQGPTDDVHYNGALSLATGLNVETSLFGLANRELEGLGVDLELLFGLLSTRYASGGETRSVGTPFWQWGGDLRYRRHVRTDSVGGLELAGRIGIRSSSFGTEEIPEVARISHRRLALAIDCRVPLAAHLFELEASAAFEPLIWASGGRAERQEKGWSYGLRAGVALVSGRDARGLGLLYGVRLDYARLSDSLGLKEAAQQLTESWVTVGAFVGYAM